MSTYFHDLCVKEDGIEYTLFNDNKCTVLKFPDNIELGKIPVPKPPLVSCFEIPEMIKENNPLLLINDIIKGTIGDNRLNTNILSLYIMLTHCFDLFDEIPLLYVNLPNYVINVTIEDLFRKLCFNGISIQSQLSMDGIIKIVDEYTPTLIFNCLDRKLITKYPILLKDIVSKQNAYLDDSLIEKSIFCPRILLSMQLNNKYGNGLHISLRNANNTLPLTKLQIGEIHMNIINFILKNQNIIKDSYNGLYKSNVTISRILLPLLSIAMVLNKKGYINKQDYEAVKFELIQNSSTYSPNYSMNDEIVYGLLEFLKKDNGRYNKKEFISLDMIVQDLKSNSNILCKLNSKALSQYLRQDKLIAGDKRMLISEGGILNNTFKKVQRTCIKLNKYQLNKKAMEFRNVST